MIEHLVLFKVKSEIDAARINRMLDELSGLTTKIQGIVELSCGENTSDRSQGFTHGLRVVFQSRADLEAYLPHEEHKRVVSESVLPICEELLVVDYEPYR